MSSRRAEKISTSALFKAVELQEYSIHPDGARAACSVNKGRNYELAVVNLTNGKMRRILSGDQALLSPTYSPCGTKIAYQADFEGNEDYDVHVIEASGKNPRKITDGVADNENPEFSPDGKRIAFVSTRKDDMENLYVVDAEGGEVTRLTNEDLPVREFAWSPDGRTIAYCAGISDGDYISTVDTASGKTRRILSKKNVDYGIWGMGAKPIQWSNDGSKLMFISNEYDSNDIGVLDLSTRRQRWLVRSANDKYSPLWSPDESKLAYLEVQDPNIVLKIKDGGRTRVVSQKTGVSRSHHWLPGGSGIVFINGSSVRPEEMFIVRRGNPKRLTKFQRGDLPTQAFAQPRLVKYRSFDGRRISAMLFVPKGGPTGRGVVIPHGGPEMQSLNLWDQIVQMFVIKGFSVILPNYRGSTGYGREFLHLHNMDLGGGDLKDVIYGGRYLVRSGFADKERLGFWGASYGGYMCMLALTKFPEMWAAGVSIVGYFDCVTEFESERGFLKAYDLAKMGDPKDNPELWRDRSPINFLEDLTAPILLTASARDVRCPPTETREVVRRLKKMGKEHAYHEYKDEGHWPRKRKNLKDLYERSVRFLDKHIAE